MSLKKNAFYGFVRAFMTLAFPVLSFPYVTRIFSPDVVGKVNFSNAIIDYFLLLAGLGIAGYASHEASRIRDNKRALNAFAREMLAFNLISMVISYVLFLASVFFIPKLASYRMFLLILGVKIFFESVGLRWLFTAQEENRYIAIRQIVFQLVSLVFLFIFVKNPNDYRKYAFFCIISSCGTNVLNIIYASRFINIFEKHPIHLARHIKPVFIFFGVSVAGSIYAVIDSTMLGIFSSDEAVGFYAAANKLVAMVISLSSAIIGSFMPRCTYYYEKNEMERYRSLRQDVINVAFFLCVPAAIGLFAVCKPALILFCGEQYISAANAIQLLSPVVLTNGFMSVIANCILLPQKRERTLLCIQIFQCAINALCNIPLIIAFGVKGAAMATFISELVVFLLLFIFSRKAMLTKAVLSSLLKVFFASGAMFFCVKVCMGCVQTDALKLLVGILSGFAVYAILVILMRHESAMSILRTVKNRLARIATD